MVEFTIDGKTVQAEPGESLLKVMLAQGLEIPYLCYHPAVEPYGACRLCQVEVTQESHGRKKTKLTTSCNFPVMPGIEVVTESERITETRKGVISLLLARAPEAKAILDLAAKYGVEDPGYREEEHDGCIVCGLCVQMCRDVIGAEALGFTGRGDNKDVGVPFADASRECIGCASCASVCPTQCIEVKDEGLVRTLPRWNATHQLVRCRLCGQPVATVKHLRYLQDKLNLDEGLQSVCPSCRRQFYAERVAVEGHM